MLSRSEPDCPLQLLDKANYVDRQKKITNLALVIAKNRRQVTGHIALKTNKFRGHRFRSYSLLKGESRAHLLTDTLPLARKRL